MPTTLCVRRTTKKQISSSPSQLLALLSNGIPVLVPCQLYSRRWHFMSRPRLHWSPVRLNSGCCASAASSRGRMVVVFWVAVEMPRSCKGQWLLHWRHARCRIRKWLHGGEIMEPGGSTPKSFTLHQWWSEKKKVVLWKIIGSILTIGRGGVYTLPTPRLEIAPHRTPSHATYKLQHLSWN